jgi:2-haloacid dehalogenase
MPDPTVFVFDAYGTLFDVHAAIGRHRSAAGPDADRFSEIWRTKQLEYVMGAATFGFRPIWVNRSGAPDEYTDAPPTRVITNLASL